MPHPVAHRRSGRLTIATRRLAARDATLEAFLVENRVPTQLDHPPQRLKEDAAVHLARAQNTVNEHNGYLLDGEAHAMGCELHLNLECIALELDGIQVDGLQHLATVAHIAGSGIFHLHARNQPDIGRRIITHQHSAHRPVHDIYP